MAAGAQRADDPVGMQRTGTSENRSNRPAASAAAARVLYIEQDADSVQLARTLLDTLDGVELVDVPDGAAGLELARTWAPHLVLLDLGLPDIHGTEVLRALRDDGCTRTIPIIVVSANSDARGSDAVRAAGLAGYLVKPIDICEFLTLIGRSLGLPSSRDTRC